MLSCPTITGAYLPRCVTRRPAQAAHVCRRNLLLEARTGHTTANSRSVDPTDGAARFPVRVLSSQLSDLSSQLSALSSQLSALRSQLSDLITSPYPHFPGLHAAASVASAPTTASPVSQSPQRTNSVVWSEVYTVATRTSGSKRGVRS
jgi:hypothetical protein